MPPNSKKDSSPIFDAVNIREGALVEKFNLIDKAAKKDMHWWFFVLLMIGMITVGFLYVDMRKERADMRNEISNVRDSQLKYLTDKNELLMSAIVNNTRALETTNMILNRIENSKRFNE